MSLVEVKIRCKNGRTKRFFVRDLTGKRFGKLIALKRIKRGLVYFWECVCNCGNKTVASGSHLIDGHTKSCGCLVVEARKRTTKHGYSRTPEYKIWRSMISRCYNPKNASYHRYGGNNIGVCEGWYNSFHSFIKDMGKRPSDNHSIDRIDNTKWYSCGHCDECKDKWFKMNCRWETPEVQSRNMSTNVFYEYNGDRLILPDYAKKYNISLGTLSERIRRGYTIKKAIEKPIIFKSRKK